MHMVFLFRLNSGGRRGYALYILEYEMHCTQLSIMPREACAHWASTRCVREDCKSSLRIHTRCVAVWAAMHASWVGVVFTSRYLGRCVAVFARRIPLLCHELSWVAATACCRVAAPPCHLRAPRNHLCRRSASWGRSASTPHHATARQTAACCCGCCCKGANFWIHLRSWQGSTPG